MMICDYEVSLVFIRGSFFKKKKTNFCYRVREKTGEE